MCVLYCCLIKLSLYFPLNSQMSDSSVQEAEDGAVLMFWLQRVWKYQTCCLDMLLPAAPWSGHYLTGKTFLTKRIAHQSQGDGSWELWLKEGLIDGLQRHHQGHSRSQCSKEPRHLEISSRSSIAAAATATSSCIAAAWFLQVESTLPSTLTLGVLKGNEYPSCVLMMLPIQWHSGLLGWVAGRQCHSTQNTLNLSWSMSSLTPRVHCWWQGIPTLKRLSHWHRGLGCHVWHCPPLQTLALQKGCTAKRRRRETSQTGLIGQLWSSTPVVPQGDPREFYIHTEASTPW